MKKVEGKEGLMREMGVEAYWRGVRVEECPFKAGGEWARLWRYWWEREREKEEKRRALVEVNGVRSRVIKRGDR